jgi:cystathionine gamma-synthase
MEVRDLLTDPAWRPEDLGCPLPDSPHAVSVAIPTWQDVVDYEEGHPRIAAAFQCGYPRFFLHPMVQSLFAEAERRFAAPGECALVFPHRAAAERCRAFVVQRTPATVRLESPADFHGAVAVLLPQDDYKTARLYWRYCGDTLSSRMAEAILTGSTAPAGEDTASAEIRARLAGLHGISADGIFLYPSGMGAVSALHRALRQLYPDRPSVQLDFPYVDVLKVQEEYGGVKFLAVADDAALEELNALAAARAVSGVFCEMPSNPLLRCVRVSRFAPALRENDIPLFIDDTIAGVTNIDALRAADAVTTSLTKAFSGAGDVIAGAVTLNPQSPHYSALHRCLAAESPQQSLLWPADAAVLNENSRDFPARAAQMSATAAALAAWLEQHPAVESVYYPRYGDGIEEVARPHPFPAPQPPVPHPHGEPSIGRGCLLSFVLKNPASAPAVYDALRVSKGPSLGTNFTLCCPYTLLAHYTELEWAAQCGVRADLLRVSTGLEPIEDLIARFAAALQQS